MKFTQLEELGLVSLLCSISDSGGCKGFLHDIGVDAVPIYLNMTEEQQAGVRRDAEHGIQELREFIKENL